jgi:hypothetical protein
MKKTYWLFCLCLSLTSLSASAQELFLGGVLLDAEDQSPLPGANVQLIQLADSAQQLSTTSERGFFRFTGLKKGQYFLKISYIGYTSLEKQIDLQDNLRLGQISLSSDDQLLNEVEVRDKLPRAEQKGDTTEFNSQAYKTQPDANAEDLIRKMPGIVVQNGQVQAQGENVQEVLVDGQRFFGNDPATALKNLPAEVIDKIQVFDRQSDQSQFTGFDDGQSIKTINIITRSDKRTGEFGKVYAGYGLEDRYHAGGNMNLFKGDKRLSVIGQSNNINIQNFASEDLLGVLGSSGQGGGQRRGGQRSGGGGGPRGGFGRGGGGANASDFMVGQQNGIILTNAIGINYSDKIGEKLQLSGSYFFNNSNNSAEQRLNRETFLTADSSLFYNEREQVYTDNTNHRMNMRLEYQINKQNSIVLQPGLSWQQNRGDQFSEGNNFQQGGTFVNGSTNTLNTDLRALNFSNSLLYRRSFEKRGRTFSLRLNTQMNEQNGANSLMAYNAFQARGGLLTDTLNQQADLLTHNNSLAANISYTEPLGDKFQLQFNVESSYRVSDADRSTFRFEENSQTYSLLDSTLSNNFQTTYLTNAAGTGLRYNASKFNMMARVNYEVAELQNQQFFPADAPISRSFHNLLPFAMMQYRFDQGKNLRVFYRTSTSVPEVGDLQAVLDNSNPLQLRQGNPALDQQYQHNLFARFGSTNAEKATVFFLLLGGSYTTDYVGSNTIVAQRDTLLEGGIRLPRGAQLVRPDNFDNSWSLRSFMSYGLPLEILKSNLNFNTSVTYNRTPSMLNGQMNFTDNTSLGAGLVLSSNISPMVDFTISSRSNYNLVSNSIRQELGNNFFTQTSELRLHARTEKGLFVETDASHQLFSGLADEFNQGFWLVNISMGKKLFKDQLGEIKVTVFDLLNQNNSISRTVGETFVEDVQTQILQRYAMLTFTYQIRNFRL